MGLALYRTKNSRLVSYHYLLSSVSEDRDGIGSEPGGRHGL